MNRRSFLTGGAKVAAAIVAAPWVVRAESLMPIVSRCAPAYFGVDLGLSDGGLTMVQWVTRSGMMSMTFGHPSSLVVPDGVHGVWVSSIASVKGHVVGKLIAPCRDDLGQIFSEPRAVVPGSIIRIGRHGEAGPA